MLERRDAEDDVEGSIRERQAPDVGDHAAYTGDISLGEVDADDLACSERCDRREPRRLGERVPDVEHPLGVDKAAERPGKLDRTLVDASRARQLVWPLSGSSCGSRPCHGVLEGSQPDELVARGKVRDERGARQRLARERAERVIA